ncbi:MAG: BLUF domain-containing protein [Gammaproteobacteria bacterium]|nr:BLUF domain-containing protein [Gammaproteobacteria bacterium]
MYHLIYTSRSTLPQLPESGIYHLLSACSVRNRVRDITSVLAYRSGVFIGYIEGRREDVLDLYTRIEIDPRHLSCRILAEDEHRERWFPGIYMGYLNEQETASHSKLFDEELNHSHAGAILEMFRHAQQHPETIEHRIKHEISRNAR